MAFNTTGLGTLVVPATVTPDGTFPVSLANTIRGGIHTVAGTIGDTLADIDGSLLADGMLVYIQTRHNPSTVDATNHSSFDLDVLADRFYQYNAGTSATRDENGRFANASINWDQFRGGGLEILPTVASGDTIDIESGQMVWKPATGSGTTADPAGVYVNITGADITGRNQGNVSAIDYGSLTPLTPNYLDSLLDVDVATAAAPQFILDSTTNIPFTDYYAMTTDGSGDLQGLFDIQSSISGTSRNPGSYILRVYDTLEGEYVLQEEYDVEYTGFAIFTGVFQFGNYVTRGDTPTAVANPTAGLVTPVAQILEQGTASVTPNFFHDGFVLAWNNTAGRWQPQNSGFIPWRGQLSYDEGEIVINNGQVFISNTTTTPGVVPDETGPDGTLEWNPVAVQLNEFPDVNVGQPRVVNRLGNFLDSDGNPILELVGTGSSAAFSSNLRLLSNEGLAYSPFLTVGNTYIVDEYDENDTDTVLRSFSVVARNVVARAIATFSPVNSFRGDRVYRLINASVTAASPYPLASEDGYGLTWNEDSTVPNGRGQWVATPVQPALTATNAGSGIVIQTTPTGTLISSNAIDVADIAELGELTNVDISFDDIEPLVSDFSRDTTLTTRVAALTFGSMFINTKFGSVVMNLTGTAANINSLAGSLSVDTYIGGAANIQNFIRILEGGSALTVNSDNLTRWDIPDRVSNANNGVPSWSTTVPYVVGNVVTLDNNVYLAVADSVGEDPSLDTTQANWRLLGPTTFADIGVNSDLGSIYNDTEGRILQAGDEVIGADGSRWTVLFNSTLERTIPVSANFINAAGVATVLVITEDDLGGTNASSPAALASRYAPLQSAFTANHQFEQAEGASTTLEWAMRITAVEAGGQAMQIQGEPLNRNIVGTTNTTAYLTSIGSESAQNITVLADSIVDSVFSAAAITRATANQRLFYNITNSAWENQDDFTFDTAPTASSNALMRSGALHTEFATKQDNLTFTGTESTANPVALQNYVDNASSDLNGVGAIPERFIELDDVRALLETELSGGLGTIALNLQNNPRATYNARSHRLSFTVSGQARDSDGNSLVAVGDIIGFANASTDTAAEADGRIVTISRTTNDTTFNVDILRGGGEASYFTNAGTARTGTETYIYDLPTSVFTQIYVEDTTVRTAFAYSTTDALESLDVIDSTTDSSTSAQQANQLVTRNYVETSISAIDTAAGTLADRVAANETNIASNDTDIASLRTDLMAAQTNIMSNDDDIGSLRTDLTTAQGNITSNDTDIGSLRTDLTTAQNNIMSNDTDIGSLRTDLMGAQANITSNDTDIMNLTTRVADNETNIGTNDTDITALQTRATALEAIPRVRASVLRTFTAGFTLIGNEVRISTSVDRNLRASWLDNIVGNSITIDDIDYTFTGTIETTGGSLLVIFEPTTWSPNAPPTNNTGATFRFRSYEIVEDILTGTGVEFIEDENNNVVISAEIDDAVIPTIDTTYSLTGTNAVTAAALAPVFSSILFNGLVGSERTFQTTNVDGTRPFVAGHLQSIFALAATVTLSGTTGTIQFSNLELAGDVLDNPVYDGGVFVALSRNSTSEAIFAKINPFESDGTTRANVAINTNYPIMAFSREVINSVTPATSVAAGGSLDGTYSVSELINISRTLAQVDADVGTIPIVSASPTGTDGTTLNRIRIDNTNYNIGGTSESSGFDVVTDNAYEYASTTPGQITFSEPPDATNTAAGSAEAFVTAIRASGDDTNGYPFTTQDTGGVLRNHLWIPSGTITDANVSATLDVVIFGTGSFSTTSGNVALATTSTAGIAHVDSIDSIDQLRGTENEIVISRTATTGERTISIGDTIPRSGHLVADINANDPGTINDAHIASAPRWNRAELIANNLVVRQFVDHRIGHTGNYIPANAILYQPETVDRTNLIPPLRRLSGTVVGDWVFGSGTSFFTAGTFSAAPVSGQNQIFIPFNYTDSNGRISRYLFPSVTNGSRFEIHSVAADGTRTFVFDGTIANVNANPQGGHPTDSAYAQFVVNTTYDLTANPLTAGTTYRMYMAATGSDGSQARLQLTRGPGITVETNGNVSIDTNVEGFNFYSSILAYFITAGETAHIVDGGVYALSPPVTASPTTAEAQGTTVQTTAIYPPRTAPAADVGKSEVYVSLTNPNLSNIRYLMSTILGFAETFGNTAVLPVGQSIMVQYFQATDLFQVVFDTPNDVAPEPIAGDIYRITGSHGNDHYVIEFNGANATRSTGVRQDTWSFVDANVTYVEGTPPNDDIVYSNPVIVQLNAQAVDGVFTIPSTRVTSTSSDLVYVDLDLTSTNQDFSLLSLQSGTDLVFDAGADGSVTFDITNQELLVESGLQSFTIAGGQTQFEMDVEDTAGNRVTTISYSTTTSTWTMTWPSFTPVVDQAATYRITGNSGPLSYNFVFAGSDITDTPAGTIWTIGNADVSYQRDSTGTPVAAITALTIPRVLETSASTEGVIIQNGTTPLAGRGTVLSFTGDGVTASGTGSVKTINIPGGGIEAAALLSGGFLLPTTTTTGTREAYIDRQGVFGPVNDVYYFDPNVDQGAWYTVETGGNFIVSFGGTALTT